jgi:hypothetical protein
MCHITKELKAVTFRLDGVGIWILNPAGNCNTGGLDFKFLAAATGFNQFTLANNRAAGGDLLNFGTVIVQLRRRYDLDGVETGSVVDGNERKPGL